MTPAERKNIIQFLLFSSPSLIFCPPHTLHTEMIYLPMYTYWISEKNYITQAVSHRIPVEIDGKSSAALLKDIFN
jgi:hypothetical protein